MGGLVNENQEEGATGKSHRKAMKNKISEKGAVDKKLDAS